MSITPKCITNELIRFLSTSPTYIAPDSNSFASEEECVSALFQARWPDGFICPRCQHRSAYIISTRRLPLYECQACRAQTSLIVGTVMEGSRTHLRLWFKAIQLHSQPNGVNALQLSNIIGVTYKTAWLICHKLRFVMSCSEAGMHLTGQVRITNTIIYKRLAPTFDYHRQEQSLIMGSSENDQGEITHLKIEHQDKRTLKNQFAVPAIQPFILRHVDPKVAMHTITSSRLGPKRNYKLHQISWDLGRWLAYTFNGIGPKHLQRYLDQYVYMRNRHNQSIFTELLQGCALTTKITYPMLIRNIVHPFRPTPSHHHTSQLKIAN